MAFSFSYQEIHFMSASASDILLFRCLCLCVAVLVLLAQGKLCRKGDLYAASTVCPVLGVKLAIKQVVLKVKFICSNQCLLF